MTFKEMTNKKLGILKGDFWGFRCPNDTQTPCWLRLNPFMPEAAKAAWLFWNYLSDNSNIQKIFEGEMLIKIQRTTLLQIFCEFVINRKVIFKSA